MTTYLLSLTFPVRHLHGDIYGIRQTAPSLTTRKTKLQNKILLLLLLLITLTNSRPYDWLTKCQNKEIPRGELINARLRSDTNIRTALLLLRHHSTLGMTVNQRCALYTECVHRQMKECKPRVKMKEEREKQKGANIVEILSARVKNLWTSVKMAKTVLIAGGAMVAICWIASVANRLNKLCRSIE